MTPSPTAVRAAVFRAAGQPMTLESFPLPSLQGSECLVQIRWATICGSDLHSFFGRRPTPAPSILGHEMVGQIAELGPVGATDYRGNPLVVGDRITWSMVWSCGECFYCRRELRPKCEHLMKFGHEPTRPGRALLGGFAEYCHLPERTAIFRVPTSLPDLVASPANCATATVAAVFRHAGSCVGQSVLIQGAGMLGLTACAMAVHGQAAAVIVVEPDPQRRQWASRFGATCVLDSREPDEVIREQIRQLTQGQGVDVGLELSGQAKAIESGMSMLRPGGKFLLCGSTFPTRPVQVSAEDVVRRLLQIQGVYNYQPEDLETALAFLSATWRNYPFEDLVGPAFELTDVQQAFEFAEQHRPARVAVRCTAVDDRFATSEQ
jgi:putative phosphonate catabolism associated alcohol dehydrogenase